MLSEELGVSDKILFAGWLGKAEKDHLLARAAIFVLPSYHEGVPMAILEAMSWGIPIVTTPVGGMPEVVTEGQEGLLVNSGDIVGLAHALARLLAAPSLRRAFGERGRHKIESRFSIKVLATATGTVVDRLRCVRARARARASDAERGDACSRDST
ncbi:glycosyl transferase family 1 [Nitrosospira multiformis]|uniref:Glycosyl transferase family 1 n=1 Tax=Nitrosospira multiformis TaxID=1231 RepID=A0A2T5IE36_9PROT|nr:glycosyl transferase family 1 [Nitrosospira multiformis]